MTQFAAVLKAAMTEMGMTQDELADQVEGVSQGSISRFLLGDGLPKKNTLEQICRIFPPEKQKALFAAYVTDQIPASAVDLVAVNTIEEHNGDTYSVHRAPVGSILRHDIEILERRAIKDPNLAMMLNYLASMVDGEAPHPEYYEQVHMGKVSEDPLVEAARDKLKSKPLKKS